MDSKEKHRNAEFVLKEPLENRGHKVCPKVSERETKTGT